MNGSEQQDQHSSVGDQHEYAAIAGFLAQANGFRFTVLGLFVAAAGFVLQQPARSTALLVLILSVLLWGSELRTRAILGSLMDRARSLERGASEGGNRTTEPTDSALRFVHALSTIRKDQKTWFGPPRKMNGHYRPRECSLHSAVTHTVTIDLIYLVVAVYCLLVIGFGPEHFQPPQSCSTPTQTGAPIAAAPRRRG